MTRLVRSVRVVVVAASIHAVGLVGCTAEDARECTTSAACEVGERCVDGRCLATDGGRSDGPSSVDAARTDGGSTADGGSMDGGTVAMDGGLGTDGGGGDAGGGPSVACGAASCTPADGCCVMMSGAMCTPPGMICSGITLRCDGPEDCASMEFCCNGSFAGAMQAQCIGPMALCPGVIACHDATDCVAPDVCCPFDVGGFTTHRCQSMPC